MDWKDNLQPASWRGVSFGVIKTQTSGGRRIKEIERWQKRTVTVDQGPTLVKFTINAFVVQNAENNFDYFQQRDKLLDKLQNVRGPGTLIHPFHGRLRVHASRWAIAESFDEGGIAKFDIEFDLEQTSLFPGETKDSKKIIDDKAVAANNLSIDSFINIMNVTASFVQNLISPLTSVLLKIQTAVSSVNNVVRSTVNAATGAIGTAINTLALVLNAPCELFETLQAASESFGNLVGMAGDAVNSGVVGGCSGTTRGNSYTLDGDSIPESLGVSVVSQMLAAVKAIKEEEIGSVMETQDDNLTICINTIKLQLLIFATRVGIRINFSSQNQLLSLLADVLDAFDDYMENRLGNQLEINNTDMFLAAEEMKTSFIVEMTNISNTLTKEIDYESPSDISSTLVLSYDKYLDLDRCSEIFNKNKTIIKHPGFIPGNEEIRILED